VSKKARDKELVFLLWKFTIDIENVVLSLTPAWALQTTVLFSAFTAFRNTVIRIPIMYFYENSL